MSSLLTLWFQMTSLTKYGSASIENRFGLIMYLFMSVTQNLMQHMHPEVNGSPPDPLSDTYFIQCILTALRFALE